MLGLLDPMHPGIRTEMIQVVGGYTFRGENIPRQAVDLTSLRPNLGAVDVTGIATVGAGLVVLGLIAIWFFKRK